MSSKRILLVDDEEGIRAACQQLLVDRGYDVLTAANGADALEQFERLGDSIDVVLLDQVLPGLSGPEVLRRLRARHPQVRVVVMSGDPATAATPDADLPGAVGFLQKPFQLPALVAALESAVAGPVPV